MNKHQAYQSIQKSFQTILDGTIPWESALVSLIALLKENLNYVSWVGFYRLVGDTLWIGPYQGKVACLYIPIGKGVCGAAVQKNETQLVPNVDQFPGHIACDSLSRSELVVCVKQGNKILGVLDLDSHSLSAFDEIDSQEIQKLLASLEKMSGA